MVNVEVTGSKQEAAGSTVVPGEPDAPVTGWLPLGLRGAGRAGVRAAWRRHQRPLTVAACLAAIAALYVAYLGQSRSLSVDADGAGYVLQAWEMLHGNPLLRGWWLTDATYYTTELPQYVLLELGRGLNAGVINVAGAATYTLLVALAAVLAKGRATGTAGLFRVLVAAGIMLAPGLGAASLLSLPDHTGAQVLLTSPDHIGTQVPLLLVWLAIDRLGDRWYLPWLAGALLTWVGLADQLAVYVGALPVIVVSAIRLYQRRESWRVDAGLLVAAAASVVLARAGALFIRNIGGFTAAPAPAAFAAGAQLPHNVSLTVESVLSLFGADFFGLRFGSAAAFAVVHLVGVVLVAWACCIAGRRLLAAGGRLVPILFVGIVINIAAFVFSTQAVDLGSTRELAAVLPFGAVLAGRLIPGRPAATALRPVLGAVLAGYAGMLAFNATQPPRPPATQAVASWLTAHHLTAGIGTYWTANVTTVATSGRVRVRPVTVSCRRLIPYAWAAKESWYQPPSTAKFFVIDHTSSAGARRVAADAVAQFGRPRQVAQIGAFEVLVWHHDLLPAVTGGYAPGCGPAWHR